jgi:hypothetical protein
MYIIQEWKSKCSIGNPHDFLKTTIPIDLTTVSGWHLVTFTTDGLNTAKIYWDGVAQVTAFTRPNCTGIPSGPAGNEVDFLADINYMGDPFFGHFFDIGVLHHGGAFDSYYNGAIDDVRIYNCPLSQADIQKLFTTTP